jgi:hypothetical protein
VSGEQQNPCFWNRNNKKLVDETVHLNFRILGTVNQHNIY